MATRKQMRKRTRKQRGGDGDGTEPVNNSFFGKITRGIKGTVNSIKGFFGKPTDSSAPSSPGVKQGPLLKSSKPLSGDPVAITVKNTPPAEPVVKVNKPLTPPTTVGVATPQSNGLTGSFTGPIVSLQQPQQTAVQAVTPQQQGPVVLPGQRSQDDVTQQKQALFMQPPPLTTGGRRKKHRHTRRRSMRNKRK